MSSNFLDKGEQRRMVLVVIFFEFVKIDLFCFVVAICALVHDVEAMHGIC